MRIDYKMVPQVANEVVDVLLKEEDIAVEPEFLRAAQCDLAALIKEFLQPDNYTSGGEDCLENRQLSYEQMHKLKQDISEARHSFKGEEATEGVINKLIDFLMISDNFADVFSEDRILRKHIFQVIKKYENVDADLDLEARKKLKNLQEGTPTWDLEYKKLIGQLRRSRNYR